MDEAKEKKPFPNPFAWLQPKPRPKTEFADLYIRTMAAGVDLWVIYLVFNYPFRMMTAYVYRGINHEQLEKINAAADGFAAWRLAWEAHIPQLWMANALAQLLMIGVPLVLLQCKYGYTPGKYLLGLRVVRHRGREKPACWRFLLRYLAYIPSAVPLMIGIFWISFNRDRRGWHDYIAGTSVITTRDTKWYVDHLKKFWYELRHPRTPDAGEQ